MSVQIILRSSSSVNRSRVGPAMSERSARSNWDCQLGKSLPVAVDHLWDADLRQSSKVPVSAARSRTAGSAVHDWHAAANGSGGRRSPGRLAAPTARQYSAWSASGPWSPVVGELPLVVTRTCDFALNLHRSCGLASQDFSSLWAVFRAHVPWMCPVLP
jgi:hypothetical protein